MTTRTFPVIVPAAGVGKRMGSQIPKQYLPLEGKTLLENTLEALLSHPGISRIILVLHPQDPYFQELVIASHSQITVVAGGKERADSVLCGLTALHDDESWVLVHDAARPCLKHQDLDNLLQLAQGNEGGILATPVRDTMKRGNAQGEVASTECRNNLWHALTPQFFPSAQLLDALSRALAENINITDEASAIEWAGGSVKLVEASPSNIKVTLPDDIHLAAFYLQQRSNT